MTSTLGLAEATTTITVERVGRFGKKPDPVTDTFLDWTVDGTPLRKLIINNSDDAVAPPEEEITCLLDRYPDRAIEQIDRLLGRAPAEFDDRRVALFVCPMCFDLACGAVSAQLIIDVDTVEWRNLGWQTSLQDGFVPFTPLQRITFDRHQYEDTLMFLRTRYGATTGAKPNPGHGGAKRS